MPTIRIFPNALDDEPDEIHKFNCGDTFEAWLIKNVDSYKPREHPLFSAKLNGADFPPSKWVAYQASEKDCIDIFILPKDAFSVIYLVVSIVSIGYSIYVQNQIPDNYNSTTPDGSNIYSANLQANRPRLMGVVPEIAGRHKHFPDMLNSPRREYIDNEQWIYFMLCVGVGEYDITQDDIYIGETPISRYAGDIEYSIHSPGDDLSSEPSNRNFYLSDEVGSTSGGSGIELKGLFTSSLASETSQVKWEVGYRPPEKFFAGTSPFSVVMLQCIDDRCQYQEFPFAVGQTINIEDAGINSGTYRVKEIEDYYRSDDIGEGIVEKLDDDGDVISDWAGFTFEGRGIFTVYPAESSDDGFGVWEGPFFACPQNEKTNLLALDFFMPAGLGKLEDSGTISNIDIEIEMQYRVGDGEWVGQSVTFSGESNDQMGKTVYINLPEKSRPEVRVRRLTNRFDDTRIFDTVEWQALRSELETAQSYPNVTTLSVKMRGTNALARSAENKINVIATRKLPVYDSQQWSGPVPTRDISPFFAYVVKSVGHTDRQLDLDEIERLHAVWRDRGDEFNGVFDNESTLFDVLKRVLSPGFAEPTLDNGKIIPVRDEPRSSFDYMYQPDNMVSPLKRDIKLYDLSTGQKTVIHYRSAC